MKKAFDLMDTGKSGKIKKAMVVHYLTLVGDKIPAAELEPLMADVGDMVDLAAFRKLVLGK